jgi:hypothetical protein
LPKQFESYEPQTIAQVPDLVQLLLAAVLRKKDLPVESTESKWIKSTGSTKLRSMKALSFWDQGQ